MAPGGLFSGKRPRRSLLDLRGLLLSLTHIVQVLLEKAQMPVLRQVAFHVVQRHIRPVQHGPDLGQQGPGRGQISRVGFV